jgi:DNA-binding response OmpR family regulator
VIVNESDWNEEPEELRKNREPGFPALKLARRPRIVVAEDSEELGRGLMRHMRRADYIVHLALDGVEALDAVRDVEPDVLLLDLGLPRLHGFKLLHALRTSRIDVPVIVLTGETSPATWERALRFGVRKLFLKPTTAHELIDAIDEVLREG